MASITGLTRDGQVWTPKFATSIDMDSCIGCGMSGNLLELTN